MADNGTVEELTDIGTRSILVILLTVVFLVDIVLNCLLIFVYIRSKQLQKAPNYLFLNLVAADILAAIFWVIPSIIAAATSKWILGDAMCIVQGFAMTICHCSNMHTFLLMSFEKALRICWPSRHFDVFYNTVVLIMIGALWMMGVVFSIFPLIGWSKLVYFQNQYQCSYDYTLSVSHLNFMFVLVFLVPIILGVVCYVALFYKVKKIQQRVDPRGNIILEENKKAPKITYADKLKRQQDKFKHVPLKKNKPKIAEGKSTKDDGYESADMNTSSSADEAPQELWKGDDYRSRQKHPHEYQKKKKRIFRYRPEVTKLAITIMITWLVYSLLWFMYYVLSYYWTFEITNQPTDATFRALTFFTFLGLVVKIPIYVIHNKRFRNFTAAAFKTDPNKKKPKREDNEENEMKTRTTRKVVVTEESTVTRTTTTSVTPVWLQNTGTNKTQENEAVNL